MRPLGALAFALAVVAAAPGCGKKKEGPVEVALGRLSDTGVKVEAFRQVDARTFAALSCRQGRVESLDAVLCDYGTPEAWARGKKAAEDWIGSALTGTWATSDGLLLVVADRARIDPSGKTIQRVMKAFSGKR
jgi:hypothetical protein